MESSLIPLCANTVNFVGQFKFWCLISGILRAMMQAYSIPGIAYMENGKDHKVNFFMYEAVGSLLEQKSEQKTRKCCGCSSLRKFYMIMLHSFKFGSWLMY